MCQAASLSVGRSNARFLTRARGPTTPWSRRSAICDRDDEQGRAIGEPSSVRKDRPVLRVNRTYGFSTQRDLEMSCLVHRDTAVPGGPAEAQRPARRTLCCVVRDTDAAERPWRGSRLSSVRRRLWSSRSQLRWGRSQTPSLYLPGRLERQARPDPAASVPQRRWRWMTTPRRRQPSSCLRAVSRSAFELKDSHAALGAYQRAEIVINAADSSCNLEWELLAAWGKLASDHGRDDESLPGRNTAEPG